MATTTQHKQIRIDGMTGDECCQKVTKALENVEGVQVESVEVGTATITVDNEKAVAAARQAIDSTGFSARQDVVSPKSQGADKHDGRQQSQPGYRTQNSNQNAPSGIGRAATEGAAEADGGDSNEDSPSSRDTAQRPGTKQSRHAGQGGTSPDDAEGMNDTQSAEEKQDENLPTSEIDRGADANKQKKVGDAGRDDRDRGDPMPERVNGPGSSTKQVGSGPRPANEDKNPTTNPAGKPGQQSEGKHGGNQGNTNQGAGQDAGGQAAKSGQSGGKR